MAMAEKMLNLAQKQKIERELIRKRNTELEVLLDQKQALELHVAMKHLSEVEEKEKEKENELKEKLESIQKALKLKDAEIDAEEDLNHDLVILERRNSAELQDVRKELIKIFNNSDGYSCVKRMGELDRKPFIKAANIIHAGEDVENKAVELCSLWEDYLRDPSWHPYKIVKVGEISHKEVLDENDPKLTELKTDFGDEVYEAVTTALNEINEYNPSGRFPVKELWNSSAQRKASVGEASGYLCNRWKTLKGKRRLTCRN